MLIKISTFIYYYPMFKGCFHGYTADAHDANAKTNVHDASPETNVKLV